MPSLPSLRRSIAGGWPLLLIAIAVFAAFWPALHNGFIWDDDRYIESNLNLTSLHGLFKIWFKIGSEPQYYPLTHTTLWIEYHLWGQNPLGYHLDNILLHLASAIFLWRLLRRLSIPGALAAAMIFAVHPVQVESVAWATERKNVLSGFFYFLSLGAYLAFANRPRGKPAAAFYAASLALFICALLSKSVASTLPAVILLLIWWKTGRIRLRDFTLLIPFFIAGIAMGSLTGFMEKHIVGAIGPDFDHITPLDRICVAGRAIWFYLVKLAWPAKLTFIYPRWIVDPRQRPWLLLFTAAAIALPLALLLLIRRLGRGPATAILFFIGTLVPALGFVNVFPMRFSWVADHFQYLAAIGPIVLVVAVFSRLPRAITIPLGSAVILALCIASNLRAAVYFDRETLWADTVEKNSGSNMVHENYADALRNAGKLDAAEKQYRIAISIHESPVALIGLGQCFAIRGDYPQALRCYSQAVRESPDSSEPVLHRLLAAPWFQVGTAYQQWADSIQNNPAAAHTLRLKAIAAYETSLQYFPDYEIPRTNLATLFLEEGRPAAAAAQCRAVLANDPDSIDAHINLGNALRAQSDADGAIAEYQQVLRLQPGNLNAMCNIGSVLAACGQFDAAEAQFQNVLKIDPEYELAQLNLARLQKLKQSRLQSNAP